MDEVILDMQKVLKKAGNLILRYYHNCLTNKINYKSENNPVTQADLDSEKIIINNLKTYNYPFLSEESTDDKSRLDKEYVWILDPLDGTTDYIQKTDEFSIILALVKNGRPTHACIYQPTKKKFYIAVKNKGAYLVKNNIKKKLNVSNVNTISKIKLVVSRNHLMPVEDKFSKDNKLSTPLPCGSAGLKIGLIAEGKADLYINSSDKTYEWDICAGHLLIQEAGGILTDKYGKPITYNKKNPNNKNGYIASNNKIHNQITEELGKYI